MRIGGNTAVASTGTSVSAVVMSDWLVNVTVNVVESGPKAVGVKLMSSVQVADGVSVAVSQAPLTAKSGLSTLDATVSFASPVFVMVS